MPAATYLKRTIGEAWAAAVLDWQAYVVDVTATWAISMTNVSPLRAIVTATTIGGVTQTNTYVIAELTNGGSIQVDLFLTSPGMRVMPKALQPTYGARSVLTEWRNVMVPFRRVTMTAAMGITARSLRQETDDHSPINYDTYSDFWIVRSNGMVGTDALLLTLYQGDWTWILPNDQPITDGLIGAAPPFIVDTSKLVASVDQIAYRDMDVSFANGQVIVSCRGSAAGGT